MSARNNNLDKIEHIVVLRMENRSFDNVLGWLYPDCHTQFDHTSVIKTASNKWLNGQNLTRRDLAAADLSEMLSLSTPRTDTPEITPLPLPEFSGCAQQTLSPLHSDLLASAAHFLAHETTRLVDLNALKTKEAVVTKLDQMWESFAGK